MAAPQGLYLVRQRQSSLTQLEVWFFAGSRFVQGPPAATLGAGAAFDFVRAETQRAGSTGTLAIEGDRMTLSGPARPSTSARLDPLPSSTCLRWNEGLFCPAPRFAPGARLDGVFAAGPAVTGATVLRAAFKADGSYEIMLAPPNAGAAPGRERGRYEISGSVLRLRPVGGGTATSWTVVPYDDGTPGPAPRRLFLGGVALGRQ